MERRGEAGGGDGGKRIITGRVEKRAVGEGFEA